MAYEGNEIKTVRYFAKEIFKNQGFIGFYKGLYVNVIRAAAANAAMMSTYDTCK